MSADSVIRALLHAIEESPDDADLRLHVAELLAGSGDSAAALGHLRVVLQQRPDEVRALTLARDASASVGDEALAARYGKLAAALGAPADEAANAGAAPPKPVHANDCPATDEPLDEFDAFLRDVVAQDEQRRVRLGDVAGLADVKRRLELSFLGPLRVPELRAQFRSGLRGGMLLYGPPGCGKTYLARALAGELDASFIPVLLNDVLDMWLGNSEKQLHSLFEAARRRAPSVMFFDELDAIGMRRTELRGSAGRNIISQLLTELDGVAGLNDDVFVLGATNQPWDVDPALRRPGRFDRTLLVLPPDREARQAIIERNLRDVPTGRVDVSAIAASTDGYSGADLRLLCESAVELALEASVDAGHVVPVSDGDLRAARKQTLASTGGWFDLARNAAYFANQDGAYDELVAYLDRRR
jgi:AAA+ superfamily predicted ATPase